MTIKSNDDVRVGYHFTQINGFEFNFLTQTEEKNRMKETNKMPIINAVKKLSKKNKISVMKSYLGKNIDIVTGSDITSTSAKYDNEPRLLKQSFEPLWKMRKNYHRHDFYMSLDKIATSKIGGITDELEKSDFPVFVDNDLSSYCTLEYLIWEQCKALELHDYYIDRYEREITYTKYSHLEWKYDIPSDRITAQKIAKKILPCDIDLGANVYGGFKLRIEKKPPMIIDNHFSSGFRYGFINSNFKKY